MNKDGLFVRVVIIQKSGHFRKNARSDHGANLATGATLNGGAYLAMIVALDHGASLECGVA